MMIIKPGDGRSWSVHGVVFDDSSVVEDLLGVGPASVGAPITVNLTGFPAHVYVPTTDWWAVGVGDVPGVEQPPVLRATVVGSTAVDPVRPRGRPAGGALHHAGLIRPATRVPAAAAPEPSTGPTRGRDQPDVQDCS